jgi:alcohol dehydrogenase, propanol-preferring
MRAMVLDRPGLPLRVAQVPIPEPGTGQALIRVHACAVCRTDLHIVDGELPDAKLPLILGHQIVGTVVRLGEPRGSNPIGAPGPGGGPGSAGGPSPVGEHVRTAGADQGSVAAGDRVGVPWLGYTCGHCRFCLSGRENLCDEARFTGYQIDGGYAEYTVADVRFCFPIPPDYPDLQAAPLLCAGLIGFRSLRMAGKRVRVLGIYGFGAAAHIVTQVARHRGVRVYAFTRPGDTAAQEFALDMGAVWAGSTLDTAPEPLDAALIFAPAGDLVPTALRALDRGGVCVCGGIHMSDIPSFPYDILWGERVVRSVANLTRSDGEEFLALAPAIPVHTEVRSYPLEQAGQALADLRDGSLRGSAVLLVHPGSCETE